MYEVQYVVKNIKNIYPKPKENHAKLLLKTPVLARMRYVRSVNSEHLHLEDMASETVTQAQAHYRTRTWPCIHIQTTILLVANNWLRRRACYIVAMATRHSVLCNRACLMFNTNLFNLC